MLVLLRGLTYATLFIALFLVFVPQRILTAVGFVPTDYIGLFQFAGLAAIALGAALVLWCVLTFALVGKGTPALFDPPRKLVVAGPYRFVRNPMYIGAATAMLGAALFYESSPLALYAIVVLIVTHLLVRLYEEPQLRRVFGQPYEEYLRTVHRWMPTWRS
jgi:protein-S-isoprenylcysteine O-methyltransferase Ste14